MANKEEEKKEARREARKEGKKENVSESGSGAEGKGGSENKSTNIAVWIIGFIALFAVAYAAINFFGIGRTNVTFLDGMRIETEAGVSPTQGLVTILSATPQIVRIDTQYNATDQRNSVVARIANEAINTIAQANRTVGSYVVAYDAANLSRAPDYLNCNVNNSQCGKPTILVTYGSCNCFKIMPSNGLLTIEGDETFVADDIGKVRGVINMILSEINNSTTATISG